jgi:Toprim domain
MPATIGEHAATTCANASASRATTGSARTPSPKPTPHDDAQRDGAKLLRAAAIWNEAGPIAGTDGEAYFAGRGIVLDDIPDHGGLRWHPRCPWGLRTAPCIVARFTTAAPVEHDVEPLELWRPAAIEPRGIWRRPLTGEKPKSLGSTAGCVIRLWPDDAVESALVLGEGPETTLAAATRIIHRGSYLRPAWAAGSASNMAAFPALSGVGALTPLVDHDDNGACERAAEQCAREWRGAGREVIRLMPGDLGDFNHLVKP